MSDTYQHGPGSIVSPQSPGERKKPHPIQMPPRTFSHRSSSHVITLTRIWAPITGPCIVPRLYSQRMAFFLCGQVEATANSPAPSFLYEARSPLWLSACQSFLEEKHNSKRFILTCTHNYVRGKILLVGGVGFEPTHPKGPDLQSGAALQLDRPPKYIALPCICLTSTLATYRPTLVPGGIWVAQTLPDAS